MALGHDDGERVPDQEPADEERDRREAEEQAVELPQLILDHGWASASSVSELSTEAWSPTAAWIRSRIRRTRPLSTRTFTPPTDPASPTSSVARSAVNARVGGRPPNPAAPRSARPEILACTRRAAPRSGWCRPPKAAILGGDGVDDHVVGTRGCPSLDESNGEHLRVVGPVAHQAEVETFRLTRLVEQLRAARHDTVRSAPPGTALMRWTASVVIRREVPERSTRTAVEAAAALGANGEVGVRDGPFQRGVDRGGQAVGQHERADHECDTDNDRRRRENEPAPVRPGGSQGQSEQAVSLSAGCIAGVGRNRGIGRLPGRQAAARRSGSAAADPRLAGHGRAPQPAPSPVPRRRRRRRSGRRTPRQIQPTIGPPIGVLPRNTIAWSASTRPRIAGPSGSARSRWRRS